jgi:hypothetical protein
MKILLGDFNEKVGREDIFKPTNGNESSHEISNDNGVRVVNFATSKNLVVKRTMFPHRSIHKYTWTSPDGKTHIQIDHILIDNILIINKSVALQALTNLARLSSRRWQSFPTAPDGTGLTCGQHIFSFPNRTVTSLFK